MLKEVIAKWMKKCNLHMVNRSYGAHTHRTVTDGELVELAEMTEAHVRGNDSAVAAIQYALSDNVGMGEGMDFLQLWNVGEFDTIRAEWPDAPDEIFIGADPLFKPKGGA